MLMKSLLFLLVVVGSLSVVSAAPLKPIKLWPGKPPGAVIEGEEVDRTTEKSNKVAGRRLIRLSNVSEPSITVYPAPEEKNSGAAVIICPGGGYHILALDLEGTEVAEWLNSIGATGIVLKYRTPTGRLPVKWQTPLMDAQRAVSLARSRAAEWKLDPKKIGIMGFSAGGNLSGLTATRFAEREYEKVDAVDEVSARPDFACLIYPAWLNKPGTTELQDYVPVSERTPPMFFAHAADDRIECQSSIAMFLALRQHKVPAELHVYAAGGHGYGLRRTEVPVTTWPDRMEDWLRHRGVIR